MADFQALREGVAANLAGIPDLNESAYLLSNPTPPAAEVQPSEIDFDASMGRGADWVTLIVRVFVGLTTDIGAQKRLDRMLAGSGADSVKAAVEVDTSLGGVAEDLQVVNCTGYRTFSREGGPSYLGAEWMVRILVSGT